MGTSAPKPYTMEEIRSRIDQAERELAAGLGIVRYVLKQNSILHIMTGNYQIRECKRVE